jgi:hypothetical protein
MSKVGVETNMKHIWDTLCRGLILTVLLSSLLLIASAETVSYCDSIPMQMTDWNSSVSLPMFDPGRGNLNTVDISVDFNISQNFMAENTGLMNSSLNSTTDSRLTVDTLGGEKITANATMTLVKELGSFDGLRDFSGPSGINLTESTSSGTVRYSSTKIQDFVASFPGETVQLKCELQSTPSVVISGTANTGIQTTAGAQVCISYNYDLPNNEVRG